MNQISQALKEKKFLILDSAMGTELKSRGMDTSLPLWSAKTLIDWPDVVRQIHIDNIDAGADIITTNTFRTQRRTFEKAGFHHEQLDYVDTARFFTRLAVDIAKEAVMITRDEVMIAGSIAPLEDCYRPDLVPDTDTLCTEHNEHILNLVDAGADFLLAETMNSVREISAVVNQIHQTGKEYCISLLCRNEKELFSGESIADAVKVAEKFSPVAIMVNCVHPEKIEALIRTLKSMTGLPIGVYANIGEAEHTDGSRFIRTVTVNKYYDYASKWKDLGAKIIGGCCGTNPHYVEKLSSLKSRK